MAFDQNSLGGVAPRPSAPPPPPRPAPPKPPSPAVPAPPSGGPSALRVSLMPTELMGRAGPNLGRRLMALGLVVIMITLVIGGFNYYLGQDIAKKASERDQLWAQVDTLAKTLAEGKDKSAEAVDFERQAKVAAETLDAHVYWSIFFKFLEDATKDSVRYEKFSGDAENGFFAVDAIAKSYRDMAEQIVLFRDHPLIASVKVSNASEKIGTGGLVEGVSFSVIAKVKPGVWKQPASDEGAVKAE